MAMDVDPFLRGGHFSPDGVLPDKDSDGSDSGSDGRHLELVTKDFVVPPREISEAYKLIFEQGVRAGRDLAALESAERAAEKEVIRARDRLADVEVRLNQLRIEELYRRGELELAMLALANCEIAKPKKKKL